MAKAVDRHQELIASLLACAPDEKQGSTCMKDTNPNPRITVFIPAYNAEHHITEAIESILAQTWTDYELLLIDDGSQDTTADVMTQFADDPRVRIVCNLENSGIPWTRNEGLRLARGEYIALIDADDIADPERLQRQLEYLDSHPEIAVLGSRLYKFDKKGRKQSSTKKPLALSHDNILALGVFTCPLFNPTVMARTQSLQENGYNPAFPRAEDYDLWNRMLGRYRFAVLSEYLLHHRQHKAQITKGPDKEDLTNRKSIQERELRALGLHFSESDITKHVLISCGRKTFRVNMGHDRNHAYLIWAREWFEKLISSNVEHNIYPEPAFSHVATLYWASLCAKSIKTAGLRNVALEYSRSKLKWRLPVDVILERWKVWQEHPQRA